MNTFVYTLQRQFRLYIPFLGIARPQPQFPHSCVCERFICSQDRSTYFLQQKRQTHRGNIEFSHRYMNVEIGTDWGPDIPFLGIFVSNFRHFVFAVQNDSELNSLKNGLHILQRRPNDLCSVCINLLFLFFLLGMHERALGRFSGWCIPCQIRSGISRRRGNGSGHTTVQLSARKDHVKENLHWTGGLCILYLKDTQAWAPILNFVLFHS